MCTSREVAVFVRDHKAPVRRKREAVSQRRNAGAGPRFLAGLELGPSDSAADFLHGSRHRASLGTSKKLNGRAGWGGVGIRPGRSKESQTGWGLLWVRTQSFPASGRFPHARSPEPGWGGTRREGRGEVVRLPGCARGSRGAHGGASGSLRAAIALPADPRSLTPGRSPRRGDWTLSASTPLTFFFQIKLLSMGVLQR